jgi:hypothetical protein
VGTEPEGLVGVMVASPGPCVSSLLVPPKSHEVCIAADTNNTIKAKMLRFMSPSFLW